MTKKPLVQAVSEQMEKAFDIHAIYAFRRFIKRNVGTTNWLLLSDYNIGDKDRPHDVIAFTVAPFEGGKLDKAASAIGTCFDADFKNIRRVSSSAKGYFWRRSAAFHICWILEKRTTLLHREGMNRLDVARWSIDETDKFLKALNAPKHLQARSRALVQLSKSNNFAHKLFDKMLLLSVCYSFIVGLLHRECKTTQLVCWCSDRDALTTWADKVLDTFALMNAVRWATHFGKRLDAEHLPRLVLRVNGPDPFDAALRPSDYLAAALSSWSLKTQAGMQGSQKYRDVLRGIVSDNPNIALLSVDIGELSLIKPIRMTKRDD